MIPNPGLGQALFFSRRRWSPLLVEVPTFFDSRQRFQPPKDKGDI
ncbi:hypothetical protein QUB63_16760 [Microcoleus sp. ARI1-B5]